MATGGACGLGVTTNKECLKKLVLMHQASLCEFQSEFKFRMEDILWWYKYMIHCVVVEI